MPVRKTFNAAQNQVLISPVSSYYQGKAIRLALENKALANEALQQEVDMADAKLDLETRKVKAQEGVLEQRIKEYGAEVGEAKALEEANTIIGITEGAKSAEDPLAYANERMPEFIATLPEGEARAKLEKMAEDGFQAEELKELYSFSLAVNKQFGEDGLKPTGKMIEAVSMGYEPGSPEYAAYLKGTGKDGKPLAAEVKAQMVVDALNGTFKGEPIDAETQAAILDSLDVQRGPKGSITIKWDDAADYAESIIDRTGIRESSWFTLQRNPQEFEDRLTWSLMRLAKDGGFGGKELEERALADSIGVEWNELLDAQAEKNAKLPEDEQFSVMDMLKLLAEK